MDFDTHLKKCLEDPAFRAEWEAHEDCHADYSRLMRRTIRLDQLRQGRKAQLKKARGDNQRLREALTIEARDHCTCQFPAPLCPVHESSTDAP